MEGAAMQRVQSWWRFRHQLPDGTPGRSDGLQIFGVRTALKIKKPYRIGRALRLNPSVH